MAPRPNSPANPSKEAAADESHGSDTGKNTNFEAICNVFCLVKGSGLRSHSEVSVVTSVEDDSRLLAASVASLLDLYATQARDKGLRQITAWDSPFVPKFSVHDFLDSLMRNFQISSECCAVSFIYIDRFMRIHPKFAITFANVHRILLTAVVVAAKFCEDTRYSNAVFAGFFGLSAKQMAGMELYLVRGLDWGLYVSQEECEECQSLMMRWGEDALLEQEKEKKRGARKSTSRERAARPRRTVRRF